MTPSPETIVSQSSSIIATDLDGEIMMMSIERGEYYAIEPMGARIWNLIKEPTSIADLCENLLSEFDVDRETCQRDVQTFVTELHKMQVIELS